MAVITDYDTLVQAIIDNAEDDGLEFSNYIPTAIDLAEEFIFRDLDFPDLEIKASGTMIPAVNTIAKPSGYRFANYIKILVPDSVVPTITNSFFLKKRRDDYIQDYWPNSNQTAMPKYYSDSSVDEFSIAPTPDQAYAYEIKYTEQPTKLSTTTSTNYFTDRCKDVLFAACMVEMVRFMKAWAQVPVWEAEYAAAKANWMLQARRVRRDDGHTPHNPTSGPNTVVHTSSSTS